MTVEQILDFKLKKILGDTMFAKVDKDTKDFILAYAKSKIQIYCHRQDIPSAMNYIWADIAIELLKLLDASLFEQEVSSEMMDRISGINVGDTQISFHKMDTEAMESEISNVLNNFASQLKNFRKILPGNGDSLNGI